MQDVRFFAVIVSVNAIIKVIGIMLLAGLAAGCSHEEKNRQSIINVLQARLEARKDSIVIVHALGCDVRKFNNLRALHNLKRIDTSDCPNEFQTAWLAYIQAWERFANPSPTERRQKQILASPTSRSIQGNLEGHAGLGAGAGAGISGQYSSTHENYAKLAEMYDKEDTSEAFRTVESVALKFKVDALKFE